MSLVIPKLEVGQRVSRLTDVFNQKSPLRLGSITERYQRKPSYSLGSHLDELYAVKWDDTGLEERGYFRHGLNPIAEFVER
jgi:hypothetical protein